MATTYTPNYHLGKQEDHNDKFDMNVLTQNADIIDTALHDLDTSKQDAEDGMGLSEENFTNVLKTALETINAAFPFSLQRGEYTLNDQSELTFDTLADTKYYRYTASAIGNPVSGGYGIIINIRYTAYAVQLLFSQTTATAPTQLLYRIGTNMSTTPTWRDWQTVSSGGGGGGGVTKTVLFDNPSGAYTGQDNALTDNYDNYDVLYLNISTPYDVRDGIPAEQKSIIPELLTNGSASFSGYYQRNLRITFSGSTFNPTTTSATGEVDGYKPNVYKIIGIKY